MRSCKRGLDLNLAFGMDRLFGVVNTQWHYKKRSYDETDGRIIRTNWSLDGGRIVGRHVRVVGMGADVLLAWSVPGCAVSVGLAPRWCTILESGPNGE